MLFLYEFMLQPSLGGYSVTAVVTAVVCNITPAVMYMKDSLTTLEFASRAKRIENAPVKKEVVSKDILIRKLKIKVTSLEAQLINNFNKK